MYTFVSQKIRSQLGTLVFSHYPYSVLNSVCTNVNGAITFKDQRIPCSYMVHKLWSNFLEMIQIIVNIYKSNMGPSQ